MNAAFQTQAKAPTKFSFTPAHAGLLQRTCACGGALGIAGKCEECSSNQLRAQRRAVDQAEVSTVPPVVDEVLRSPGQPLDAATRAFMEPRFGHDFSRVNVHTNERAAASAQAVNALAYTVGNDIVFGAGQYAPNSLEGKRLIAHELTHTVQQSGRTVQTVTRISQPGDANEQEADRVAQQVVHLENKTPGGAGHNYDGETPRTRERGASPSPTLQRQAVEGEEAEGNEELFEIGDQLLMAMPQWHIVTLPNYAPSANSPGSGPPVLQRQAGTPVPDVCNTPQTMRKVTSGKFEGGKTLDDYYPDLVGANFWGKNDTAGPFDNGFRMGSAVQLISEYATPCIAGGSPFTFDQSISWVRLRADGKKVAENGKVIEGQTYDDLAHSLRDKTKAPFRQEFDSAISIADPISGVPYAGLKSYECKVNLTASVSGPGGSKSVNWGVTMEASGGKVTKNEVR